MGADLYRTFPKGKYPERDKLEADMESARETMIAAQKALPPGSEHAETAPNPTGAMVAEKSARDIWRELYERKYDEDWYFRDGYNDSSLFWMMDLSWWQDLEQFLGPAGDGVQVKDEDGYDEYVLYPPGQAKLINELVSRSELMHRNMEERGVPKIGKPFTNLFGEEDRELDQPYYEEKLKRLLQFLHTCKDAGDGILCSV